MSTLQRIGGLAMVAIGCLGLGACAADPPSPLVVTSPSPHPTRTTSPPLTAPSSVAAPIETHTTEPPPAASQPTATIPPRCSSDMLSLSLGRGSGALGSVYLPIDFTNTSDITCTLYGFPGVSALAFGQQVGVPAERDLTITPQRVSLQPGQQATATLRIANAHNYPEATCQLVQASAIRVYPPNSYNALVVPHEFSACSADQTFMTIRPVSTG